MVRYLYGFITQTIATLKQEENRHLSFSDFFLDLHQLPSTSPPVINVSPVWALRNQSGRVVAGERGAPPGIHPPSVGRE